MNKEELDIIKGYMSEVNQFVKDVRAYLYEIEKQRPLTQTEQDLWGRTHNVHQHINDTYLMIEAEEKLQEIASKEAEGPELD